MSLVTNTQLLISKKIEREALISSHEKAMASLNREIADIKRLLNADKSGLDSGIVQLAESVLCVSGKAGESSVRMDAVQSAIAEIANAKSPLAKEYIGVKRYSGFGDQRSDHGYGYGPRHGSIVFRIASVARDREWTEEERNAAIYYLMNITEIQACEVAA